jgi:hypothetical protein
MTFESEVRVDLQVKSRTGGGLCCREPRFPTGFSLTQLPSTPARAAPARWPTGREWRDIFLCHSEIPRISKHDCLYVHLSYPFHDFRLRLR